MVPACLHVIYWSDLNAVTREDIENNRRIYFEAVQEMVRIGAPQIDRFVLISSAGLDRVKPEYSDYLKDVLAWKKKGELSLKASGVPYSIVRAYSLNNESEDAGEEFTVAVFQGDPDGVAALITRKDLGEVAVEALLADSTKNATFEVGNARKNFMVGILAVHCISKFRRQSG